MSEEEEEENILEIEIKNFANYLMDFGLLNASGYTDFCKKFNEINKNKLMSLDFEDNDQKASLLNFKDTASKTILDYLKNLSEPRKLLIALNIYSKYTEKKENKNQKQSEKNEENSENEIRNSNLSEKITQKVSKKDLNKLLKTEKFFFQLLSKKKYNIKNVSAMKPKINNYNDNNLYNRYTRVQNIKPYTEHNKNKAEKYIPFYNKSNNKQETTKENNLNENCVFQPNIYNTTNNKKISLYKKNISQSKYTVFDRLFQISKKKKEIPDENLNKNWFKPNYSTSKNRTRESFDNRLRKNEENKKLKEKIKNEEEQKEFHEKCPFAPKTINYISKNKSFQNEPIYLKLYKENDKRKKRQELRIKQSIDEIKDMSNHPIMTRNKIEYLNTSKDFEKNKNKNKISDYKNIKLSDRQLTYELINKDFEKQKIEQLYNDYKQMKNIIQSNRKIKNNNQLKEGYGYIKYAKESNNNSNYDEELIRDSNINKNDITNEQSKYANEGVNDISENRAGINDISDNKLANENEKISIKKLANESEEMNDGDLLKENEIVLEDNFDKNNNNYLNENQILNEDDLVNEDMLINMNDIVEGDINSERKNY